MPDFGTFPMIEPDADSPCGCCKACGRGPFVILAEPEPQKARCPYCRGPVEVRPDLKFCQGMELASPPLIESGSSAWETILELRRSPGERD